METVPRATPNGAGLVDTDVTRGPYPGTGTSLPFITLEPQSKLLG